MSCHFAGKHLQQKGHLLSILGMVSGALCFCHHVCHVSWVVCHASGVMCAAGSLNMLLAGCFWGRQKDFVDTERKLGRAGGNVSAVAGYAGGADQGAWRCKCSRAWMRMLSVVADQLQKVCTAGKNGLVSCQRRLVLF